MGKTLRLTMYFNKQIISEDRKKHAYRVFRSFCSGKLSRDSHLMRGFPQKIRKFPKFMAISALLAPFGFDKG